MTTSAPTTHRAPPLPTLVLPAVPTRRALRTCALFGLGVRVGEDDAGADHAERDGARLAALLASRGAAPGHEGAVALVTGPSGSGKSRLARALGRRVAADAGSVCVRPPRAIESMPAPHGTADSPVDRIKGDLTRALGVLSAAGLADAHALATPTRVLSDGQRQRLALAIAMDRAERLLALGRRVTLIADEFAMTLDAHTAQSVAHAAARWARRVGCTLVAAAAREHLDDHLRPDITVRCALGGRAEFVGVLV